MVSPPYWQHLAAPNKINQSTPFSPAEMGKAIYAKERI
jgi:hypothetical protein